MSPEAQRHLAGKASLKTQQTPGRKSLKDKCTFGAGRTEPAITRHKEVTSSALLSYQRSTTLKKNSD